LAFAGQTSATTSAVAAITKNVATAAAAVAGVSAQMELRVTLVSSVQVSAAFVAAVDITKRMSGAGDEVSTAAANLAVRVNMQGMLQSYATTNTTIYITKRLAGYEMAMAVVVDAHLRKLFRYTGIDAGFVATGELVSLVEPEVIDISAELQDSTQTETAAPQIGIIVESEQAITASASQVGEIAIEAELVDIVATDFLKAA
jgi:hypothetical protein